MVLGRLQRSLNNLSKAERRIAEVILDNPTSIVHMTTAELARAAEVSDPMVSRLCRSIECSSFPDLKLQIAGNLANRNGNSYVNSSVSPNDSTLDFTNKIINANQHGLEYLRSGLDLPAVDKAIDILANAKRIEIYGMGGTASVAQDAQNRLFRMGIPAVAYEDTLKQHMSAAIASKGTVILSISFTGRTKDAIEAIEIGKNAGAQVVAITALNSPIAAIADVAISSASELEDTNVYVPMATRMVVLTLIDILTTGIALKLPGIDKRLQKAKQGLENTKLGK